MRGFQEFSSYDPGGNTIAILIFVILGVIVIDTSILRVYSFTGGLHSYLQNILLFVAITIIYSSCQFFVLRSTGPKNMKIKNNWIQVAHKGVSIIQYFLIGLIIIAILQMFLTLGYSSILIKMGVWISYFTSAVLLAVLSYRFFSWFKSNHNSVVMAYAVAMMALATGAVITAIYVSVELTGQRGLAFVQPLNNPVSRVITINQTLNSTYLAISIVSFTLTWFATVLLLRYYSKSLGPVKYWILVSLPMIYYLFQYQYLLLSAFDQFRISDPILFGILYTVLVSATRPVGGFLFGLAFWYVARNTTDQIIKNYMMISGYGFLVLFSSNQPLGLTLAPFPPFGLVSISFLGIGSYLVLVGIYSSAASIANDTELRKSIRKSVEQHSNLLDVIGTAQLERQLQAKVLALTRELSSKIADDTGIQSSLEEQEIKDYLHTVIEETKKFRK